MPVFVHLSLLIHLMNQSLPQRLRSSRGSIAQGE
jgi:hypothetical protein